MYIILFSIHQQENDYEDKVIYKDKVRYDDDDDDEEEEDDDADDNSD